MDLLSLRLFMVITRDVLTSDWSELLKRVQRDTAVNLNKCKSSNAKDRRIRWTNHRNISMWFDNWEHDLVELEFAVREPTTGKIHIPEDQLGLIGNFDEPFPQSQRQQHQLRRSS
jgi:hypothetical protein